MTFNVGVIYFYCFKIKSKSGKNYRQFIEKSLPITIKLYIRRSVYAFSMYVFDFIRRECFAPPLCESMITFCGNCKRHLKHSRFFSASSMVS